MAYTVDWGNLIVFIPQADLTFVSAGKYRLDIPTFWQEIHDIQDSLPAMGFDRIMQGLPPTSFSPRGVLIDPDSAGWRVEFEDGQYEVELVNGNSDIQDNRVPNQVSLTNKTTTGATAADFWAYLLEDNIAASEVVTLLLAGIAGKGGPDGAGNFRYRDAADTKDRIVAAVDGQGSRTAVTLDAS